LDAAEPSYDDLKREVELLRSRLRSAESQRPLEPASRPFSSADIDATVSSVLTDADRRSHLIADSRAAVAGWDNGFYLRSDDGNFVLRPGVQAQFRNVTTFREDAKNSGDDSDLKNGFEIRRLRFRFDGNAFTPDLTYSFVRDVNRGGGGVSLLDAWVNWKFSDPWAVKLGQFKDPAHHELLVSGFSQLAVERTLVNQLLGGGLTDRVQGVSVVYGGYAKDNPLYAEATFHDGANSKNTDFRDTVPNAAPRCPRRSRRTSASPGASSSSWPATGRITATTPPRATSRTCWSSAPARIGRSGTGRINISARPISNGKPPGDWESTPRSTRATSSCATQPAMTRVSIGAARRRSAIC
jgi:hypothetical protein